MNRYPKLDPYEVLNLQRGCTPAEVKVAYKREALKSHPDRALPERKEEATAKFKQVAEAYEFLSDERKRRHYDMYGPGSTSSSAFEDEPEDLSRKRFGTSPDGVPFSFMWESGADSARRAQRGRNAGRPFGEPWELFNQMFSQDFGTGRDPFGATMGPGGMGGSLFGDNDPFLQNHRSMANTMGFGFGTAPNGTTQSPFGGMFTSSSSSSSMNVNGVSESTSTRLVNGRKETITRKVDAQGNETIHTVTPEGQTVSVNGVQQATHPLLTGTTSQTRGARPAVTGSNGAGTAENPISIDTDSEVEPATPIAGESAPRKTTFGFPQ